MASNGLSCPSVFAKYFLFFFNIIFWVVGGVLLGVGIWVIADPNALKILHVATLDSGDGLVRASAIVLIVVGSIIFLTGFLGCCGAIRESPCMLLTYASIVGFVLILQIVAGILGAVFKDRIEDELTESLNKTVQFRYGMNGYEEATDGMNIMQRTFDCCGAVNGPIEWQTSMWYKSQGKPEQTVPETCCVLLNADKLNEDPKPKNSTLCYKQAEGIPANTTADNTYIHTKGCEPSLKDWIVKNAAILIGVAFGLAAIQIFCMVLACCLRNEVRNIGVYA